jgi:arylsulfatase A-like enzyme
MDGTWDAPTDFRRRFAGEEDPLPPDFIVPPTKRLEPNYDPDELLGYLHAYAGQVALFDLCLGAFVEAARRRGNWEETLLVVTSPRGYPLGEHGRVGDCDPALYGEVVHVPCFVCVPWETAKTRRCGDLIQPPDIAATVWDWLRLPAADDDLWGGSLLPLAQGDTLGRHDRSYSVAGGFSAFRTPAWLLLRHPDGRPELFVKPDDRWEANEISARCQAVVEELEKVAGEFEVAAKTLQPSSLSQLSGLLQHGLE